MKYKEGISLMKKAFCCFMLFLLLASGASAEDSSSKYEDMMTGLWVSNAEGVVFPGSFTYPSDNMLLTFSGDGRVYLNYLPYENELAYQAEVSISADGEFIALSRPEGTSIYAKTKVSSPVGGFWIAEPEDAFWGIENLYQVILSFRSDHTGYMKLRAFAKDEGYDDLDIGFEWTMTGSSLALNLFMQDGSPIEVCAPFDGSSIDLNALSEGLVLHRE